MPLLLFTLEFILMSHFKMAAKKHHNHTDSEIVDMQTQWTLCAKLKLLPVCGRHFKDWLAVDSSSTCLASVSSTSPKTYDYSLTSPGCERHLPNWNYFHFLSAIFISGVTATSGDVNIIAIETINPENIGIAVGILFFMCFRNQIMPKHRIFELQQYRTLHAIDG